MYLLLLSRSPTNIKHSHPEDKTTYILTLVRFSPPIQQSDFFSRELVKDVAILLNIIFALSKIDYEPLK